MVWKHPKSAFKHPKRHFSDHSIDFWGTFSGRPKLAFFGLWNALSGIPGFRALYGAGTIATEVEVSWWVGGSRVRAIIAIPSARVDCISKGVGVWLSKCLGTNAMGNFMARVSFWGQMQWGISWPECEWILMYMVWRWVSLTTSSQSWKQIWHWQMSMLEIWTCISDFCWEFSGDSYPILFPETMQNPLQSWEPPYPLEGNLRFWVLGTFTCQDVDAYHAQLSLGEGTYNHMKQHCRTSN